MIGTLWNTLLFQPILSLLIVLYKLLFFNFGLAVLALTAILRVALLPLSLPAQRTAKKMQDLKPKLDELKKRHGKDQQKLQKEQLSLYKEHGVNPMGGCLPMIAQFLVLIALYQVFIRVLNNGTLDGIQIHTGFLWLDLSKPDPYYILPLLAGVSQFFLSKMMMASKPPQKKSSGKKEDFTGDMASAMQTQMTYFFPIFSVIIAARFPSGLALYWVASTVFSVVQQYYVSGNEALAFLKRKKK